MQQEGFKHFNSINVQVLVNHFGITKTREILNEVLAAAIEQLKVLRDMERLEGPREKIYLRLLREGE